MTRQQTQRERPSAALGGRHASFFREVEAIRALMLEDVHRRTRPEPMPRPRDKLRGWPLLWFLLIEVMGWSVAFWGLNRGSEWVVGAGVTVALLTVVVWSSVSVQQFRAEWQRRREESLETATRSARAHDALVTQLMTFGRASLNFVADEYRDREARVARRTGLVVGPAQAGGILGLIGLGIAATSTLNRAFSDSKVMSRPVEDLVWVVLLVILSRSVTALLVRHNTSALLNYSDILQRVSSAKALLDAESGKEKPKDTQDEEGELAAEHATGQQEQREAEVETAKWAREDREIQAQVQLTKLKERGQTE